MRRPPRAKLIGTLFPYPTRFRSAQQAGRRDGRDAGGRPLGDDLRRPRGRSLREAGEGRAGDHRRQGLQPLSGPQLAGMLADALAALQNLEPVAALRASRWVYPLVNTAHIAGIALLFGAIAPLDLRLLGAWRDRKSTRLNSSH